MDIFGLVDAAASSVNPNEIVQVKAASGYTVGSGQRQTPTYADPVEGPAQVQALDGVDLRQVEALNIQGDIKAVYLRGALAGIVRKEGRGGDLVLRGAAFSDVWLVVKILESWPGWTKAAIVRQTG
mgnify:CR=1 FL=1